MQYDKQDLETIEQFFGEKRAENGTDMAILGLMRLTKTLALLCLFCWRLIYCTL